MSPNEAIAGVIVSPNETIASHPPCNVVIVLGQAESQGRRADAVVFYGLAEDYVNMPQLLAREIVDRLRSNSDGRAFWKVTVHDQTHLEY